MMNEITTVTQCNENGQRELRRYVESTLWDARECVLTCLSGNDSPEFRSAAKSYLLEAARSLSQVTDRPFPIVLMMIVDALKALSIGDLEDTDDAIGYALTMLRIM